MTFQLDFDADATHAVLNGDLTIYTVGEIRNRFAAAIEQSSPVECEIDLAGVAEIDTAGLQLMLLIKKKPGVNARFVHHSAAVLRLIDLANLGIALGDPMLIGNPDKEKRA